MNNKFLFKSKKFSQSQSGFTLIELMVAISIFMMVMIMAMGGVIVASDASKKAEKMRTAMDNVNFAMENMTRSIRMGSLYGGEDGFFTFTSSKGDDISYRLENEKLRRCTNSVCVDMVSSDVNVTTLKFFIRGESLDDNIQPSVYIIMKGSINVKGESSSFSLQTMASQRNLE